MTATDPDQIRQEIEQTRAELSNDVDALTYKVSPSRAVGERVDRAKGAFHGMKEKIMGTASEVTGSAGAGVSAMGDRLSSAASSVGDTAGATPRMLQEKAQGSPLAAGLVAFGIGVVISSLLPRSNREQQLAQQVKDKVGEHADELKQKAVEIGQDVREHIREPVRHAVEAVKSTASDAADTVRGEGQAAAHDVQGKAQQAKENISNR
jgi:hypothetical protein